MARGAFRYCDFWRSSKGHRWGAAAAIIPWPVHANPSAGGAVNGSLAAPLLAIGRIAALRFYVEDWLKDRHQGAA